MNVEKTEIEGVLILHPPVYQDERGWLQEVFRKDWFLEGSDVLQWNISLSHYACLRGLHFQISPKTQTKILRCVQGGVFDVAVDLRHGSATFGKWVGLEMTAQNGKVFVIPDGCAHGFLSMQESTILAYLQTGLYDSSCERGIFWGDTEIAIAWPLLEKEYVISAKDRYQPTLKEFCQREFLCQKQKF